MLHAEPVGRLGLVERLPVIRVAEHHHGAEPDLRAVAVPPVERAALVGGLLGDTADFEVGVEHGALGDRHGAHQMLSARGGRVPLRSTTMGCSAPTVNSSPLVARKRGRTVSIRCPSPRGAASATWYSLGSGASLYLSITRSPGLMSPTLAPHTCQ